MERNYKTKIFCCCLFGGIFGTLDGEKSVAKFFNIII